METDPSTSVEWLSRPTLHPARALFLRRVDAVCQLMGVASVVAHHGLQAKGLAWLWETIVVGCMAVISGSIILRYRWSLARPSFARRHVWTVTAAGLWLFGVLVVTIVGPLLFASGSSAWFRTSVRGYVTLSEIVMVLYSIFGAVKGIRKTAALGFNPALLLVGSFLFLITVGTILLMLPAANAAGEVTPFRIALFTATSASCVTGLVVVDTGTYWSMAGQLIILSLIQIGGLGIMTFGAFFAVIAGRSVRVSEAATLRDLLGSEGLGDVRRIVFAILGFTFGSELIGALLISPLWSDLPLGRRVYMSLFHAVSAFCNAGFSLTENSLVGMAHRWEVWGVVSGLIIVGGLGFVVLHNLSSAAISWGRRVLFMRRGTLIPQSARLTLTSRIVFATTLGLLAIGVVGIYGMELGGRKVSLADAWFQSVSFRTAGFNTVDMGALHPATKLLGILLMVAGASPGSTGGGMKTSVFGVAVVGLQSVLRGRDRVEAWGRTIPAVIVNRALTILLVYVTTVLVVAMLVVGFEGHPELFLDHLFESASAVGTVGMSTTVPLDSGVVVSTTKSLSEASQLVIIMGMFLGRVGPLTLLLALAGEAPAVRYEYPPERVTLG